MTPPAGDPFVCGPVSRPVSRLERLGGFVVAGLGIHIALLAGAAPAAVALHVLSGAVGTPALPAP